MNFKQNHFVLICGISKDLRKIYCSDGYFSDKIEEIDIDIIVKNADSYIFLKDMGDSMKVASPLEFLECLLESLKMNNKDKNCEAIRRFAMRIPLGGSSCV